ncbi:ribosome biogenesis GTPase YlqF [Mycoplasmopsis gallinarum]|uniref:Ribosome biogenesis GTPase A n=1 Tax=Mycoplasmopsis gallinarum TaxID=29557 RepID=A0A168RAQ6_9BACT|nr:ribosome biogenesis GTPase YlqF [Mycoplasmopsis gallinarum]OAB48788.1 50S ribosomal subunit maturation GTPase [Mycoplasmopsis gallinarum]
MAEEKILINWYPGHMAKAMREIKENAQLADIFIIVLDARCPISSYNEDFDQIAPHKPRLFVITKSDLMDQSKKSAISKRFGDENLLWLDLRQQKNKNIIINQVKKMAQTKIAKDRAKGLLISKIKVFVMGIPNAGKSTLINLVSQKKSLKVANFPGVTRNQKWVQVNDSLFFLDTPGILLPKLNDQEAATKLAMIGSIETNFFPLRFLANNYLKIILEYYPNKFTKEFNINLDEFDNEFSEVKAYNIFFKIAINKQYKNDNKADLTRVYKEFINWVKNLKGVTYD